MARFDLRNERVWRELAAQCNYRVKTLARNAEVSTVHLWRCCKRLFGKSPQKFLDEQRLNEACLLLAKERSVKVVAAKLGYSRPHFSREFKAYHGQSPTAYRDHVACSVPPKRPSLPD